MSSSAQPLETGRNLTHLAATGQSPAGAPMTDTAPLTFADLVGVMSRGSKPRSEWRVGAEHEKFGFDKSTLRRPAYEGPNGILAMLTGLQRFG